MSTSWTRRLELAGVLALALAAGGAACGGGSHGTAFSSTDEGGTEAGLDTDSGTGTDGGSLFGDGGNQLKALTISPLTASVTSLNGAVVTQPFVLHAQYSNGSVSTISTGSWSSDSPQVGAIAGTGIFTASGALGGQVHISATYMGQMATATLTVKLVLQENPGNVPPSAQGPLQGATTPDANVTWAYPYDGTAWPRGLLPPILQWFGGATTDDYYVHIVTPTFELQQFNVGTAAPSAQPGIDLALDATSWEKFTDSTAGAATVTVTRWDGTNATQIAKQTWNIAAASMRGTIYYWSNDLGRILRIQPGAATPDDFANQAPLTTNYEQDSCLMTCHTVSADGSTLVSGGGTYAGSYNLGTGQPMQSLGGTWGEDPNMAGQAEWTNIQWEAPALSPTGKYILVNSMAQSGVSDLTGPNTDMGLFNTVDGSAIATSGVQGTAFASPAWSPDGTKVAFVNSGDPSGWTAAGYNWQNPPPADLQIIPFDETKSPMFGSPQTMVPVGTGNAITWPSVTPDGQWVIYSRAGSFDTRNGPGDLYFASAVTPNQEVRLANLDGDGYPFAAGSRDLSYNYEPSFAPVAAGGYFWVVFTSRRTYGNILTGQADPCTTSPCTEVKQLWLAAIDQNPKPGVDPSHAAFHLTGQNEQNLAMRGFYSLPPCAADGKGCMSGTDCCGGYCSSGSDGGAATCRSMTTGCAQTGDKCTVNSDCCGSSSGTTCIAHVCSEPTPQ